MLEQRTVADQDEAKAGRALIDRFGDLHDKLVVLGVGKHTYVSDQQFVILNAQLVAYLSTAAGCMKRGKIGGRRQYLNPGV